MRAETVGSDTVLAQIVQMVAQAQRIARADAAHGGPRGATGSCWRCSPSRSRRSSLWGFFGPEPSWIYAVLNARRGADHRLPVRARAGDADVDHGRDRPGRAGGRAVPRRRGDREAAHGRHADRRQDRHADRRAARRFARRSPAPAFDEDEVLRLAASLDQGSEHPLAQAIVAEARRRGLALAKPETFESATGIGVRGQRRRAGSWRSATRR